MSAIRVATLNELRGHTVVAARFTPADDDYQAALRKAPRPVVVGHLICVSANLMVLAARVATGRVRR